MAWGASQTGWPGRLAAARDAIELRLERERDQLPHWLVVGLGAGIAIWFVLPTREGWIAFVLAALATSAAAAIPSGSRIARAAMLFTLMSAIGVGAIWWRAERVAAPVVARPIVARFEAEVVAVDRQPALDRTRLTLAPIARRDLPPRLRVNVEPALLAGIAPGARIAIRARLMPPGAAALPGSYDFARTAWFQGLGATGKALDAVRVVAPAEAGGSDRLADWRARLTAHIRSRLSDASGGIAAALVTGDRGAIGEADTEAMQRSGLAHLLSISGLHVTAVVGAMMLLTMRLLALSPWLALRAPLPLIGAAAGALAAIAYTLLSGSDVPTVRSCIAALLVLGGLALGREAITMRLVATGALVILLVWPEALAGASFQLSFAAVTAIVALHEHPRLRALFLRRDEGLVSRAGRILLSLLVTGVAVEIALAPIALFHFNKAGLYGALANIVAIPLTTFVIMPLEGAALLLDTIGLGAPSWWLADRAIGALLWTAHTVSAAPGAVAALPSMPWGAFALMVCGGLWIALWRTGWRRLGLVPLAIGGGWALLTPAPDLLVTGDGRHLGVRRADGGVALLRPRAGDYVRDLIGEAAGASAPPIPIEWIDDARCTADFCAVSLDRGGRRWRLLATRSPYLTPIAELRAACAAADIVVSDRRLPPACAPRWIKADRVLLARTGGLTIDLASRRFRAVLAMPDDHPWRRPMLLPVPVRHRAE